MKQALEAYHQDMLERGKYSSLHVVQLWDDLQYTLTSLTNKFIPSKRIARQRERVFFRNIGNQVNLLIPAERKIFLDLKHLFRKSIKLSYQSYLEHILDVASNDPTSKPNTKQLFTLIKHSKQDSASVAPLHKHNSVHQDDPTKATILNEQFQSVLVGSLLTASAPFVT